MVIKRTKIEYGGGSGRDIFQSDLFRVVVWTLAKGIKTTINIEGMYYNINFDGKHQFLSDKLCMEQLTIGEIKKLIKCREKEAFEAGKLYKINEIKNCLEIITYR